MDSMPQWKHRFNELLNTCQDELQRATRIGKRMLSATKTNSSLHETYEELGHLTAQALEDGSLSWDNPKARELVERINAHRKELESIEEEVNHIKFPGPQQDDPPPSKTP